MLGGRPLGGWLARWPRALSRAERWRNTVQASSRPGVPSSGASSERPLAYEGSARSARCSRVRAYTAPSGRESEGGCTTLGNSVRISPGRTRRIAKSPAPASLMPEGAVYARAGSARSASRAAVVGGLGPWDRDSHGLSVDSMAARGSIARAASTRTTRAAERIRL
eukprot:scaffold83512_cov62-Phaeocystis_antarctica.AAC.1